MLKGLSYTYGYILFYLEILIKFTSGGVFAMMF